MMNGRSNCSALNASCRYLLLITGISILVQVSSSLQISVFYVRYLQFVPDISVIVYLHLYGLCLFVLPLNYGRILVLIY